MKYTAPEIQITAFEAEDVIAESGFDLQDDEFDN